MTEQSDDTQSVTLGDVVRANAARAVAPEREWTELVHSVAAGDGRALDALYERAASPVFTLILRTVKHRATAEELTLGVFSEIWQRAASYDPGNGSVVAWIMDAARARASDWLRLEHDGQRDLRADDPPPAAQGTHDENADYLQQERALRTALSSLTPDERLTIETAFLSGLTYAETAALLDTPLGTLKTLIRSALYKLKLIMQKTSGQATLPKTRCDHAELLPEHMLRSLPPREAAFLERHSAGCAHCRRELEILRHVVDAFELWGTDVVHPPRSVRRRLSQRIAARSRDEGTGTFAAARPEPSWNQVAPGIHVKMLSVDSRTERVSMLVRLAPGFAYPSHRHAGVEELHLLDGELWIDGRRLVPGDYNRAEPGTADRIVWSGTGCTCVLITSAQDTIH